jgi:eukaryotic-like serine/threonine-protein kinase
MVADRYRLRRRLGSGGTATVYQAEDERLGREVAVKHLRTSAPEESLRRFRREARLGAALNHPNLVSIFDTIATEDDALIVMEYVPGRPLSEEIGDGLSPDRTLEVLTSLAAALDHAHGAGVVHRDVTPANVLIRDDGFVKLADLGIARAADATQITKEGLVVGTLPYMAPERLEGPGRGVPESDVYSLAALAFQMLSGQRPPAAAGPDAQPAPGLRRQWPGGAPAVIAALRRGMAEEPGDRPATASGFVDELAAALDRAEVREPPARVSAAPVTRRQRSRGAGAPALAPARRRAALVAVLAGVAAIAVAAVALTGGGDGDGPQTGGGSLQAAPEEAPGGGGEGEEPGSADSAPGSADSRVPVDAGEGARLNDAGFELINQGRYAEAIPVLERAVASFPEGTDDLNYAYALFNLGNALRLAGRPEEAIPILRERLEFPNQRGVVRKELSLALAEAGFVEDDDSGPGNGNGNGRGRGRGADD